MLANNLSISCTLRSVSDAPFFSVGHVLGYYNTHNPARLKSVNLFEPEGKSTAVYPLFSGKNEADIWASICFGVQEVLRSRPERERKAFALRHFGDRTAQYAVEDIAKLLHMSARRLYNIFRDIREDLENEFSLRGLIDPPDDKD